MSYETDNDKYIEKLSRATQEALAMSVSKITCVQIRDSTRSFSAQVAS